MVERVAVAYYPEGVGHATRMLGVAKAFERRGVEVDLAGGGHGEWVLERNGYEAYAPEAVDFIGDYQGGSLAHVLFNSLPRSARRVRQCARWLRERDPGALVTDDMFAAMAAHRTDTPLFVLTHNNARYYDAVVEAAFTWLINRYQEAISRAFLYPSVWPPTKRDPAGVIRIPPIALEPDDEISDGGEGAVASAETDVLLVPSTYSTDFGVLAERLRDGDREVRLVGDETWEPVPSLLPWIEDAEVVVCSGYSTVMEAAVAGTPCIVYPATDEQHGFSRFIERAGVPGFQVEHSISHVRRAVTRPPDPPQGFENGIDRVAELVLQRLPVA